MKFNDLASGTITRFDDEGRGVFDVILGDGISKRPFSVPFTTIGDEVEARCIRRMRGRFIGRLEKIIKPGPSRDADVKKFQIRANRSCCEGWPNSIAFNATKFQNGSSDVKGLPYAPWMHIRYEDQLTFKRYLINRSFENAGHSERIDLVIPCPLLRPADGTTEDTEPLRYRNRMDYCFGWKGELGMKELGSWNRYLDLDDCLLMDGAADILRIFHEFMRAFPDLKPWDAKKHEGDLRYVLVRRGMNTGDGIIALVVKDLAHITNEMRSWLIKRLDPITTSICLSENPLITDLSQGSTIVPLKGKETFDEIINDTRYTIHLNSFFQTNSMMAAVLQDAVWEMSSREVVESYSRTVSENTASRLHDSTTSRLLDLYCGLGFFGINFAKRDPDLRVSGFEIDEHAIALANENAKQNGIADRCDFKSGKAEDLSWKEIDADVCIVDPPRSGLHPKVIEALIERRYPRLIYVSCKYQRLVEELKILKQIYVIDEIQALDLFPQTPHVEVVISMRAKKDRA